MSRYLLPIMIIAGALAIGLRFQDAHARDALLPGDKQPDAVVHASPELSDGIRIIEAVKRQKKPDRNRFVDKLTGSLPEPAPGSGLTTVTPDTDPAIFNDPNIVFIKNKGESIGYITKDRLRRGLDAIGKELAKKPDSEIEQLWEEGKDLLPMWAIPLTWPIQASGKIPQTIRTLGPGLMASSMEDDEKARNIAKATVKRKPPVTTTTPGTPPTPTTTVTPTPPVTPKPPDCTQEEARIAAAKAEIASGNLDTAETLLNGVDTVKCPKLIAEVTVAKQQIAARVADLNAQAAAAATSCDPAAINNVATALRGVTHSGITGDPNALSNRATALGNAKTAFNRANASFKGKQWGAATSQLEGVIAQMTADGIQNCEPYTRATNGIAKINGLVDGLISQANGVANACDTEQIDAMITRLSGFSHPRLDPIPARLAAARKKCVEEKEPTKVSQWDRDCKNRMGEQAYSSQHGADGINICDCRAPYVKSFYGTKCVTPDQVMAEADAQCQEEFGPGAYADPNQSTYKTNVCNCGSGTIWNCGKQRCVQKADFLQAMREHVTQLCRAQYGDRVTSVKVFAGCRYTCTVKVVSPRTTYTPTRPTRRPVHDKNLSVIIGVIGVISRIPQPNTTTTPRRNCHHQRTTSKTHCGGS